MTSGMVTLNFELPILVRVIGIVRQMRVCATCHLWRAVGDQSRKTPLDDFETAQGQNRLDHQVAEAGFIPADYA